MRDELPHAPSLPLSIPLHRPIFTYILLGTIIIIWALSWLIMQMLGETDDTLVLVILGANVGWLILQGEIWRLLTSMFLHSGFDHLLANSYGLYVFGLELERLYGRGRFLIIYLLAGLFGSLASFAYRGPFGFSVGASGAIFGLVGMNLAYYIIHRNTFPFGRTAITNTLILIAINLFFGFTVPHIDNLAHIGGLVAGFALGYGLAPRYQEVDRYSLAPYIVDTVSLSNRWWVPTLGAIILIGGVWAAQLFWGGV
jgi:rhomboid protease GluP